MLLAVSTLFVCAVAAGFFANLHSTLSDASTAGIAWTHQVFHNALHGRLFQSSLYASRAAGLSVGFSENPYPYIHTSVIHVSFTPYLFAPLWGLLPNLYWLYGLIFLVNYAGLSYFAWKLLQLRSPRTARAKTALAVALLLSSGFFFTLQQKAQLLLFCGPFILASYYFLLRERLAAFLAAILLLCMISEDAAMVAATFSLYLALCEPTRRRYALWAAVVSIAYLALVLLVIQPAARHELVLTESTTTALILKKVLRITPGQLLSLPLQLLPALGFLPAFGIVYLLYGRPAIPLRQLLGLILIAPLPHWGETVVVGAGHHLMPILAFLFLALVLMLGASRDAAPTKDRFASRRAWPLAALTALFLLLSLRAVASNIPAQIRLRLLTPGGPQAAAQQLRLRTDEETANRRTIAAIQRIAPRHSLVFLTNSSVEGFIAGRSDLWKFPDYYDRADFLVLQRHARHAFFAFQPLLGADLARVIQQGQSSPDDRAVITDAMVQALIDSLVLRARTHRLAADEPHVVVLERIRKEPMPVPPSTVGFGWLRNLSHLTDAAPPTRMRRDRLLPPRAS